MSRRWTFQTLKVDQNSNSHYSSPCINVTLVQSFENMVVISALPSYILLHRRYTPGELYIYLFDLSFIWSLLANHLTDKDARAFADALKENRTLTHLDLSHNDIGEMGGIYLGAGLVRATRHSCDLPFRAHCPFYTWGAHITWKQFLAFKFRTFFVKRSLNFAPKKKHELIVLQHPNACFIDSLTRKYY